MKLATTECFKQLSKKNPKLITLDDKQIAKVQEVSLKMLREIVDICEKNDIVYHLTGGSALGAIRHKGFIPWDDDIDIDMARKDIERFLNIIKENYSEKYWIHTPYSSEKFCMPCYQLRRKNTIFQTCYDVCDEQCGIAIDIPIMENIPDNIVLRKIHGFGSLVFGFIVSCRRFYKNRKFMLQMSQGIEDVQKVFKTKIALGFFFAFLPLHKWTRILDKWNSLCKNEDSEMVAVPTGRKHYFGETYERKDFYKTTYACFENIRVKIPKEYDKYLHHMYGNYMDIPPKEKREQHVVLKYQV